MAGVVQSLLGRPEDPVESTTPSRKRVIVVLPFIPPLCSELHPETGNRPGSRNQLHDSSVDRADPGSPVKSKMWRTMALRPGPVCQRTYNSDVIFKLVEPAGVEPASIKSFAKMSTCLFGVSCLASPTVRPSIGSSGLQAFVLA